MSKFVQFDSPLGKNILYTPCKRVDIEEIRSEKIQLLIEKMKEDMAGVGIGLAANQIGEQLQLFIMEYQASKESEKEERALSFPSVPLQVFINPKIVQASEERVSFWHGCLSAVGQPMGKIATYKWIDIEAYNEKGEKIAYRLKDLAAIIFQHELRHLLGEIYLDHATETLPAEQLKIAFDKGHLQRYEECDPSVPLLLSNYSIGETIEDYAARNHQHAVIKS